MNIIKKAKIMDDAKFAIQMISSTNTNVVIMAYHQFKNSDNISAQKLSNLICVHCMQEIAMLDFLFTYDSVQLCDIFKTMLTSLLDTKNYQYIYLAYSNLLVSASKAQIMERSDI